MDVDVELKAVEWIILLRGWVWVLDWFLAKKVEVSQISEEEVLRITSLIASVAEPEVGGEIVSSCVVCVCLLRGGAYRVTVFAIYVMGYDRVSCQVL